MKLRLGFRVPFYVTVALLMQLHAADPVRFEVASVKRAPECKFGQSIDPAHVAIVGLQLKPILITAFGVTRDQIIGPSWLESDCFDLVATLPQGSTADQIPAMLRTLLAERFKLSVHKENRPGATYALVVDKGGPKMKEATEDPKLVGRTARPKTVALRRGGGAIKGTMTMETLAKYLSNQGYGQVVDATGLKGEYDISLSWVPDEGAGQAGQAPAASDPWPDLAAALRTSLGLKLELQKTQTEFLIIDHIERVPTEN